MTGKLAFFGRVMLILSELVAALVVVIAYMGLKGRPALVVEGMPERRVHPFEPEESVLVRSVIDFAVNFETLSAETFEGQAKYLMSIVSPRMASHMRQYLGARAAKLRESGEASALYVRRDEARVRRVSEGIYEVEFVGEKRSHVSDRLGWRDLFRYLIAIEVGPPTRSNPWGLHAVIARL